jgi:hypothetical protein
MAFVSCLNTPPPCPVRKDCPDIWNCTGATPDFEIKQFDTKPPFRYEVTDEAGLPIDLTGLVVEASMWASASLRNAVTATDTTLQFTDNRGFGQINVGDIIIVVMPRTPEYMTVTGFDETNKLVFVSRGTYGTTPLPYKRGQCLRLIRFLGAPAETEMIYEDIPVGDGTTLCNQLVASFFIFNWSGCDSHMPGCFCFEFKLLKMDTTLLSDIPSFISCSPGLGVEWVVRYPRCGNFLVKICATPTAEV